MHARNLLLPAAALLLFTVPTLAFQTAPSAPKAKPHNTGQQATDKKTDKDSKDKSDPYTLETCPVSGEKLGAMGDPVIEMIDGREVRFCCPACVKPFEDDKAKYFKAIDEELIKQQLPYYPMDTCVVSGEPLTEDGKDVGVNLVYKNRLIRFCCNMCPKEFKANPDKFLKKLDKQVMETQAEHYPLDTCLVSGKKLGEMGKPVEKIYGNRLVRFCCEDCVAKFEKDPTKYIAKLDEAWKAMHERHADVKPGAPDASDEHGH